MKRFTKYYLITKDDYLSTRKNPVFNLQLNYGKPKVNNSITLQANEYFSRNKDLAKSNENKDGQIQTQIPAVPKISTSNAPIFTAPSQGWQDQKWQKPEGGTQDREKADLRPAQIEQTLNSTQNETIHQDGDGADGDEGGEAIQPMNVDEDQNEENQEEQNLLNLSINRVQEEQLTNLERILNATNTRLDKIEESRAQPFQQIKRLSDVLQMSKTGGQDGTTIGNTMDYREVNSNESLNETAAETTVIPNQSQTFTNSVDDLSSKFSTAPLALKTPQKMK